MDVKIINKNVVPDRIVLYEGDRGSENLVFSSLKVNDGVNLEVLSGYLEIEREDGSTDRFLLDKTVADNAVYFTLPIGLALTERAEVLSTQVTFENESKTIAYRTKVFYIDVKYSVDGESSYEQVVPSVITQLETKLENAVEFCENIVENGAEDIKNQVLQEIGSVVADSELSLDSDKPVQNKVITQALDNKVTSSNVTYKAVYGRYNSQDTTMPMANATADETVSLNGCIPYYIFDKNGSHLRVNTPTAGIDCANKKYVDDKFSAFSPLHHFVIIPPDYDWTFNFYMVLPNKTEAFNTLAEFLDYISALSPINSVKYFGGLNSEMNLDPYSVTDLKFELDEQGMNIIGINLGGYIIPKDTIESETGETQFMFSDTVIA
ncbi:MAG: hypothetical protein IKA85_00990 [Clostridia bacterium]|nr:hypothetical protein [Clostridia bacterium]